MRLPFGRYERELDPPVIVPENFRALFPRLRVEVVLGAVVGERPTVSVGYNVDLCP